MHYEKESEIINAINEFEEKERLKLYQYETYETAYPKRTIKIATISIEGTSSILKNKGSIKFKKKTPLTV